MSDQPKPTGAPIHIISLGAGVQSSTMALMAVHGEITPMPKCAIFADTQDEPKSVYVWLDWLEKQLPFPVHRVTKGSLSKQMTKVYTSRAGHKYTRITAPFYTSDGRSAGILQRRCTVDYKVLPILKAVRKFANKKRGDDSLIVIQWIGISRDESHRMKPSREPWMQHRWPLVDMGITRRKCLEWMPAHEYPIPPRSACVYCPYHSDNEWRRLRDKEPEEFARAVQFEKDVQKAALQDETRRDVPYLHNSRVRLDQVDFSTDEDRGQQVMFGNECEGMCGV